MDYLVMTVTVGEFDQVLADLYVRKAHCESWTVEEPACARYATIAMAVREGWVLSVRAQNPQQFPVGRWVFWLEHPAFSSVNS
jgi:hypothetical protein